MLNAIASAGVGCIEPEGFIVGEKGYFVSVISRKKSLASGVMTDRVSRSCSARARADCRPEIC